MWCACNYLHFFFGDGQNKHAHCASQARRIVELKIYLGACAYDDYHMLVAYYHAMFSHYS